MSGKTHDAARSTDAASAVDNADWLKTAAIILVVVDHIGYFFIEDYEWWSVLGRWAAPPFFFLLGYAHTRAVPLTWIWLGIILTLLDSWNTGWTWVAPNILLSFALIRMARPYVQISAQRYGWAAFTLLVSTLVAVLPLAVIVVDYGSEGWLWALFGFYQRTHVDGKSDIGSAGATQGTTPPPRAMTENVSLMRLLICLVAAVVYVWQEQQEFLFSPVHLPVFVLGIGILSIALFHFQRGRSRIQPPVPIAGALRFIGHHTLEIYAIQLAGSELIIILWPGIAP
jgi:hypothetical protein